jgi:hypothetical protein
MNPTYTTASPAREAYKLPGRLGEPRMELYQDPRANPRMLKAMADYGMDRIRTPSTLGKRSRIAGYSDSLDVHD